MIKSLGIDFKSEQIRCGMCLGTEEQAGRSDIQGAWLKKTPTQYE